MYQGLSTDLANGDVAKFIFGASVILHLSQRLFTPGPQIFMDNYSTTYQIMDFLKTKGIHAAGTIRLHRFNKPPLLSDPVMCEKKERDCSDDVTSIYDHIVIVKWLDNPRT
jgi:hypothetical protein